jgi:hypoxanthine phosphoribosyltransferase
MTHRPARKPARPLTKLPARPGERLTIVEDAKAIRKRVGQLARQINRDYQGKTLHVVGVLENCFVFMADLVRGLTIPVVCYFVRSQVRDSDTGPVPLREILYIPHIDVSGKHLLLIEGVLQTGLTQDHLCQTLLAQQPASLRTATLIDKAEERSFDLRADYVGFEFSGKMLVGYGLGYGDRFRNLPYLAQLNNKKTERQSAGKAACI